MTESRTLSPTGPGSARDEGALDPPALAKPRIHGLDALRGGALLLGILLHALMPFMPGLPWMVIDPDPTPAVVPLIFVIHLFRMTTFMLLAGYFGAMVLGRRGPWSYFRDRLARILAPGIVFWPVAVASFVPLGILNFTMRGVVAEAPPEAVTDPLMMFTPGQLWFLWTLMQCVLIVLVVRAVIVRLAGPERVARLTSRIGGTLTAPAGVLLAAIPYTLGLIWQGNTFGGILAPTTIRPDGPSLTSYLGAFVAGWMIFASRDALARLSRWWPIHLGLAVVLSVLGWFLTGSEAVALPFEAAVIAVAGWTWTYGLVGLCVRHLDRPNAVIRYLADFSYWAYLLHLPLLVLFEILIADQPWPALVKIVAVLAVTMAALLITYHLLVRSTFLGKWLNGRRHPFRLWPAGRR